jgi:hydroxypyruvate reductase
MDSSRFLTHTLRGHPHGASVSRILAAAVDAVEPGQAVARHVTRDGDRLTVAGRAYELDDYDRVFVLGLGKAAMGMTAALLDLLGERVVESLIVTKHASDPRPLPAPVIEAGHPVPDLRSQTAGTALLDLAAAAGARDLLFCLLSGGGSALAVAPYPGIGLDDLQALTSALLACGARIDEINTLRRRLDRVKGGGLVGAAAPASVVSLILSDVVGSPLEAIASGPTAPDPSTRDDALAILDKYALRGQISPQIITAIETGPETLKPGDPLFDRVQNVIVGSNLLAAQAALIQAEQEGFNPYLLRADLQGEAREAGIDLAQTLRWAAQRGDPVPRPACIVAGGETTVTLNDHPGMGGRNQELALAAVTPLANFPEVMLVTLATDGEDGSSSAAGAVVTGETYQRAAQLGLAPGEFLAKHDSYHFFEALDDLLTPGSTGTNVNDLNFLFVF